MELLEALYTTRAMRRTHPDPLPEDAAARMVDAAIRAPSGSNMQAWRILLVENADQRAALGPLYREAYQTLQETVYAGSRERFEAAGDEDQLRVFRSSDWLGEHFGEAPLIALFYDRNDPSGGSIYPAVWNFMLAGRGLGVGTTLTTVLGMFKQQEVADLLGVPLEKGWVLRAAIPCGIPKGRWGLAKRKPAHEVAYADRWGQAPSWTVDEPYWRSSPPSGGDASRT
ncbi:MAG: nitroreductase family protein [Acidimicrobiia bacterium]